MQDITPADVAAVIITYAPDLETLAAHLKQVAAQVARVYLVDNSTTQADRAGVSALAAENVHVLSLGGNRGIAEALNAGIQAARAEASHVLLLDQDSAPEPEMTQRLIRDLQAASREGAPIAAIGPTQIDVRNGMRAPFVRFGFPFNKKLWPASGAWADCDFLITSGSLVAITAYDAIGPFDARLFIDNVDMEWSHRATAAGYRLAGSADAGLRHQLGDRLTRRPGGYAAVHAPIRLYYMMRNRVHLYFRRSTPRLWIAQDLPRLLLKFIGFSLFVAPRRTNARAMLRGIGDGLRGRLGPSADSFPGEGSGGNLA